MPSSIHNAISDAASRMLPRILTQVCRDPSHPAYGCFDRNWWHYKIRDFPSIILQQGGYALWLAGEAGLLDLPPQSLRELAAASCVFWDKRARLHGAFEEYYPWEQGYPPLAFSTLAVAKLIREGAIEATPVQEGLRIASTQLMTRFESQAANQQVAGLAALAVIRRIQHDFVPPDAYERVLVKTLALQTDEGWFQEYGGPDVGYLSVTIDCLWDALDAQPDERIRAAILRACNFISQITACGTIHVGLHNARNTDYLVPYGLVRAAYELHNDWPEGMATVEGLFGQTGSALTALRAIDDRYLCHYIGHSVLRARNYLHQHPSSILQSSKLSIQHSPLTFSLSSHFVSPSTADRPFGILITPRKGGIITLQMGREYASDYGWIIDNGKEQHITHWWSDEWTWKHEVPELITIEGNFYIHQETESSPSKHIALRIVSLLLGRKIIDRLKSRLIFKRARSPYRFKRSIKIADNTVVISDAISGLTDAARLRRAPRASKRHVASADSFHCEDLALLHGFTREEAVHFEDCGVFVVTTYRK